MLLVIPRKASLYKLLATPEALSYVMCRLVAVGAAVRSSARPQASERSVVLRLGCTMGVVQSK